eukprot:COSAG05_NODE_5530_length_1150_cov_1.843958_1_plen_241_part_00
MHAPAQGVATGKALLFPAVNLHVEAPPPEDAGSGAGSSSADGSVGGVSASAAAVGGRDDAAAELGVSVVASFVRQAPQYLPDSHLPSFWSLRSFSGCARCVAPPDWDARSRRDFLSLFSVLCSLLSALCSLLSALCSLLSALCSLLSALCSLLSALCSAEGSPGSARAFIARTHVCNAPASLTNRLMGCGCGALPRYTLAGIAPGVYVIGMQEQFAACELQAAAAAADADAGEVRDSLGS